MRDLVDLSGQEFIYVELELHLDEMMGRERALSPLSRTMCFLLPVVRVPVSPRSASRAGQSWDRVCDPVSTRGDDETRLEYGRCSRTLSRQLHFALLIVTWTSIGLSLSPFLLPPLLFFSLRYGELLSLTQNFARASYRIDTFARHLRSSCGPRHRSILLYFPSASQLTPKLLNTTRKREIDHLSFISYARTPRRNAPTEQRKVTGERAQLCGIDRLSMAQSHTSHEASRSLHGSRPTDSNRRRSRVWSTRMRPPRPSFAGERPALQCSRVYFFEWTLPNAQRYLNNTDRKWSRISSKSRDNKRKSVRLTISVQAFRLGHHESAFGLHCLSKRHVQFFS